MMQKVVYRFTSVAQKRCCLSSLLLAQRFIATFTANCERQFQDSSEFLEKKTIDSEAVRARGIIIFSKSQLFGQKYREKATLASKTRFSRHCFGFQSPGFSLLVGYNI